MSSPISTYTFLPWLRQGIANNIGAGDLDASVKLRAEINVSLKLSGSTNGANPLTSNIAKDVSLYGPGDIVGIESRAIIKVEPLNWITNFEPNYLPYIDFYDEDFPWRYTPAAPDLAKNRLRPWIALVVLKENEFKDISRVNDSQLPIIEVNDAANKFPLAEQLWAWAHVHVNADLQANEDEIFSEDMNSVLPKLKALLDQDPDNAYSRIICPRRLESNAAYHAFLVPVFETGRLAGLKLDPSASPYATFSAWANYPNAAAQPKQEPLYFPFYYRWYFHTGSVGDFEYLVRLLEHKPVDKSVGQRDMDVLHPGANLPGIADPELEGVLKLGGALRIPFDTLEEEDKDEFRKFDEWYNQHVDGYPHPFQENLATLINLADDYSLKSAAQANTDSGLTDVRGSPDPIITPPIYGKWHALVRRLLKDQEGNDVGLNSNWVHDVNLDPRFRVAAGFGTSVIQKNQEKFMNAAWEQVGDVLEANRQKRLGQLAKSVGTSWFERYLQPLRINHAERFLTVTAPVQKRIIHGDFTATHQLAKSRLTHSLVSISARQLLRPEGRLMSLAEFSSDIHPDNLLGRVNSGEVMAVRPKIEPEGATTLDDVADQMLPPQAPEIIVEAIRRYSWFKYLPLLIMLFILIFLFLFASTSLMIMVGAVIVPLSVWLFGLLQKWDKHISIADSIRGENRTPESVDDMPSSSDFKITRPEENFRPTLSGADSTESTRFKTALKDINQILSVSREIGSESTRDSVNFSALNLDIAKAIKPEFTIPRLMARRVSVPPRIIDQMGGETFKEVMAYPEIDAPMYKPLAGISSELFLPNINKISQNSISLLETNQRFIESYMVGLNHEFARELLWREYPTDQRGSYFRQFWDVSSYLPRDGEDDEDLREKLMDIPKLHLWSKSSNLGEHDHRETEGESEEEVVLVIRGELLKKYPTAVIYAHRAEWQLKDGEIDNTKERRLVVLSESEEANPPKEKVKTPLYEAKVDPDIYFFGFDLTAEEVHGGTGENSDDDPGWFFVIKERPGEPRFGFDIEPADPIGSKIYVWNDLAWEHVGPGIQAGDHIQVGDSAQNLAISLTPPTGEQSEKEPQWNDDKKVSWNSNSCSADLSYIAYQAPMMVAIHAAEMLPRE